MAKITITWRDSSYKTLWFDTLKAMSWKALLLFPRPYWSRIYCYWDFWISRWILRKSFYNELIQIHAFVQVFLFGLGRFFDWILKELNIKKMKIEKMWIYLPELGVSDWSSENRMSEFINWLKTKRRWIF